MKKILAVHMILFHLAFAVFCAEAQEVSMSDLAASAVAQKEVRELSLQDCVKLALENNFEVKLAKLDLYVAETQVLYSEAVFDTFLFGNFSYTEDKRQELSVFAPDDDQINVYSFGASKKLPTGTELAATWSDTRNWSNTRFVSKNPAHNAELSLDVRQPVGKNMFGFVDRGTVTLAKLAVENADLETNDRIEGEIAKTIKAYIDLLSAKRSYDIFTGILDKAQKLYEADLKNYDIGLIERVDLYASEANVANRQAELIIAENAYNRAQENLKLVMNVQEEWDIVPAEELTTYPVTETLEDCLKQAFYNRRDYAVKKRDVDMKGLDLRMKQNMEWPEIDLFFTMKMNGLEQDFKKAAGKTFVADNTEYMAGFEFSMSLENRQARSDREKAAYEKEKALVSLKKTERSVITEVVIAFNDARSYGASIDYTEKAVDLNSKKLSEEEKRFLQGRSSTKHLIDYQGDLLRAGLEDVKFIADHRKAKVDLYRSMNVILKKFEDLI
jgi:outer membrane protein TolC